MKVTQTQCLQQCIILALKTWLKKYKIIEILFNKLCKKCKKFNSTWRTKWLKSHNNNLKKLQILINNHKKIQMMNKIIMLYSRKENSVNCQ